jgi:hypothetical protein
MRRTFLPKNGLKRLGISLMVMNCIAEMIENITGDVNLARNVNILGSRFFKLFLFILSTLISRAITRL